MKTLLLVLTAAGLTGCAVYPAPEYEQPYYGGVAAPPYVVEQPVYLYGGGVYRADTYPRYNRHAPVIVPHRAPPPRFGRGHGDRDHDGIPNRLDRDRNNDGIPDRQAHGRRGGDRDGDGVPDRLEQQARPERSHENVEIPNLMDRRISGPGRK